MSTWIAVYAAVIASFALGWEVFRWCRDREPPLELDVSRAQVFGPPMDERGTAHSVDLLVIEVRNLSTSRRVSVTDVGYALRKGDGSPAFRMGTRRYEGATLPGVVEANDSGVTTRVILDDGNGNLKKLFDDGARLSVYVWTTTGREPLTSPWYRFEDLPERDVFRTFPQPPIKWEQSAEVREYFEEVVRQFHEAVERGERERDVTEPLP